MGTADVQPAASGAQEELPEPLWPGGGPPRLFSGGVVWVLAQPESGAPLLSPPRAGGAGAAAAHASLWLRQKVARPRRSASGPRPVRVRARDRHLLAICI